ncbi:MAG: radical SAM protein [Actinomycetota bacterium]|nr:radical SAM protein [Actinomycetota bacterium]
MKAAYPRYLTPGFKPFDPLKLCAETAKIVCRNNGRKYTGFYCTGVYGGISTGYTVGCLLRCVFCWVNWSRDFPEKLGGFFSAEQVFEKLVGNAKRGKVSKLRISGGEPTLGKHHLLSLLDLVSTTDFLFILETNGLILGQDKDFVENLRKYKNIHVRVSLKAGTPEGFQARTGAMGKFYKLPYQAISNLRQARIPFHVASMSDPRLMPKTEREAMLRKLAEVGYEGYLEEEICDPYQTTIVRLEKAGSDIYKK